jgi:hypothetical protein
MLNIIVFSRDRACQLELFLRSMKFYFKEFNDYKINILYTYSNDKFKEGYEKLFKIHNDKNINYIKEVKNFKDHVLLLLDLSNPYTIFFVDDIVFKNEFSITSKQFKLFTLNDEILTLSLRLHPYLTYCYPANIRMKSPNFDSNFLFKWYGEPFGDYGYPMSLDGHFFRTLEIQMLSKMLNYNNPNSYESVLAGSPLNRPKMICFEESIIVNNPMNKVQKFNNNVHGKITADYLNENFLDDYVIDLENFKGLKNISCHQEIEIRLEKELKLDETEN